MKYIICKLAYTISVDIMKINIRRMEEELLCIESPPKQSHTPELKLDKIGIVSLSGFMAGDHYSLTREYVNENQR